MMSGVQIAGRRAIKARRCTSAQVPDLQPERTSKGPSPAGHQGNSVPRPRLSLPLEACMIDGLSRACGGMWVFR